MHPALAALVLLAAAPEADPAPSDPPAIETLFQRVHPEGAGTRTGGATRAVVLLHGLRAHPFSAKNTLAAHLHDWQRPGSTLVEALGAAGNDVYAFAYGQNASIPEVAQCEGLARALASLREAGYAEIVLLGHSSGAVIARELVERVPDSGVTKVVQVSPPNGGSHLVRMAPAIHGTQIAFLRSISPSARAAAPETRKIPETVQMVVVIADGLGVGDLAVRDEYQWPPDLQAQGIPAVQLRTLHFTAMRSRRIVREIVTLVNETQPRWTPEEVEAARREMVENAIERAWGNPAP